MKKMAFALFAVVVGMAAHAQTLTGVKVEPAAPKAGEQVTVTASFDVSGSPNCNVRIQFGDGRDEQFKINQTKDVPLVVKHAYAKAGDYTVMVEPKTALPLLKCQGKNQTAAVKVAAVAAAAPAPAAAAAAGPACPEGWKLNAKSVSKKTGAFTCTAKAGTAAPATKTACPGSLTYFENTKKGMLGCKP